MTIPFKIFNLIFYFGFASFASAQLTISPELNLALANKTGFQDRMKTVADYYSQENYATNPKLFSQYKKWSRWSWYMGSHLDENGQFVNVSERTWKVVKEEVGRKQIGKSENPNARSNSGVWAPIGPYSIASGVGRADRLAFHPTDGNIIYAGTPAGGLWRTTNGGASWSALNGYLPNIGVSGIVVDRDNANILYVLTGDGDSNISGGFVAGFGYIRPSIGILKSVDGGNTWFKLSDIIAPGTTYFGFKLVQSEDFHNRFFACTSDGLYQSTDYGQTWARDNTIGIDAVYDLELGPANSGFVYACTDTRVYISANWGNPFVIVPNMAFSTPPNTNDRASLAVSPNVPNRLYASFGKNQLLYMSENNGTSFTLINSSSPVTQSYMAAMASSPSNANILIIGEVTLQRSTNGGAGFAVTGSGTVHADVHDLQFNPLNNYLYAACDGGVYRSIDQGANWTSLFNGMQVSQFYHFTGVNGNNNLILGGAQDNGNIESANDAGSYLLVAGGDGYESTYLNNNTNQYYFTTNTFLTRGTRSPFSTVDVTPPGATGFYPTIAVHPGNDQIIYAGYTNGVYRSDNGGTSWSNKGNQASAGGKPAGGLAVSANTPNRIYAANGTTLWRSDNQGDTWTTISGTGGWPPTSTALPITDINSRSTNGDEIWITLGGYTNGAKVYYSSNAGASWNNFSGSLPNVPVYCVKYTSDGDAYVGTDIGIYFMDFLMNNWVPFYDGLPIVPVTDLFVNEVNGNIRASTFGRGIWQSDLYTDCGPLLLLSGTTQGTNFYQSGGVIETTQTIPGSLGNSDNYRSPTKIIFKPGFNVRNNAKMHALIGACGQGVFKVSSGGVTEISKGEYLKISSSR